jgi:hypothetical protein
MDPLVMLLIGNRNLPEHYRKQELKRRLYRQAHGNSGRRNELDIFIGRARPPGAPLPHNMRRVRRPRPTFNENREERNNE